MISPYQDDAQAVQADHLYPNTHMQQCAHGDGTSSWQSTIHCGAREAMRTAVAGLESCAVFSAGLAALTGPRTDTPLSLTGTTYHRISPAIVRNRVDWPSIATLKFPTAQRRIGSVDHRIAATAYEKLVLADELLVPWYAIEFLVVATANDDVARIAAELRCSV